jgi:hypothetical protein
LLKGGAPLLAHFRLVAFYYFKDIADGAPSSIGNAKPSQVNAAALRTRKAQSGF